MSIGKEQLSGNRSHRKIFRTDVYHSYRARKMFQIFSKFVEESECVYDYQKIQPALITTLALYLTVDTLVRYIYPSGTQLPLPLVLFTEYVWETGENIYFYGNEMSRHEANRCVIRNQLLNLSSSNTRVFTYKQMRCPIALASRR